MGKSVFNKVILGNIESLRTYNIVSFLSKLVGFWKRDEEKRHIDSLFQRIVYLLYCFWSHRFCRHSRVGDRIALRSKSKFLQAFQAWPHKERLQKTRKNYAWCVLYYLQLYHFANHRYFVCGNFQYPLTVCNPYVPAGLYCGHIQLWNSKWELDRSLKPDKQGPSI